MAKSSFKLGEISSQNIIAYQLVNYPPPLKAHIDRFARILFSAEQLVDKQPDKKEV